MSIARPTRRQYLKTIGAGLVALPFAGTAMAAEDATPAKPQNPQYRRFSVDQDQVTLVTATGHHPLFIRLISDNGSPESWFKGKARIAPDEGVMYVVTVVKPISLSNLGVPFGTDILFIARDGKIVELHAAVMANNAKVFVSNIPVKAALQVLAGTVMRLGIVPGDLALHKIFGRTL